VALKIKNDQLVNTYPVLPTVLAIAAFAGIAAGIITGVGPIILGADIGQVLRVGVSTGVTAYIAGAYISIKFGQNIQRLIFINILMISITVVIALTGSFYAALVAYIVTMFIAILIPKK
jgi:uncharacterized membrane-anchored protein YitT (DUF2179 family)